MGVSFTAESREKRIPQRPRLAERHNTQRSTPIGFQIQLNVAGTSAVVSLSEAQSVPRETVSQLNDRLKKSVSLTECLTLQQRQNKLFRSESSARLTTT